MLGALRSSKRALVNGPSDLPLQVMSAVSMPLIRGRKFSLFPGAPIGPQLPPPKEEGSPEGENKEEGGSGSSMTDDFYDLPKGPTHKEMIAARRHYLKRQARRGLLPPSRPIRKPSF